MRAMAGGDSWRWRFIYMKKRDTPGFVSMMFITIRFGFMRDDMDGPNDAWFSDRTM